MSTTIELVRRNFAPAVEKLEAILSAEDQAEIEAKATAFTLADAIREGGTVSSQAYNWGSGENACALSAAAISCVARGLAK